MKLPVHISVGMRTLPVIVLVVVLALCACRNNKKEFVDLEYDPETFATMTTIDVSTLISDSGVVRYRIDAPIWLVYDEAREPNWKFPEGLHMEKYDNFMRREATVDCDSALYLKNKQLWRLDGYVDIKNTAGEKFLTSQLYRDQRGLKVYRDSFIHIERADRIIEGYGFESNDRMTQYRVLNVSGIFPVDQFREGGSGGASAASDSVGPSVSEPAAPLQSTPDRSSGRQRARRQQTDSVAADEVVAAPASGGHQELNLRRPQRQLKVDLDKKLKPAESTPQKPKK